MSSDDLRLSTSKETNGKAKLRTRSGKPELLFILSHCRFVAKISINKILVIYNI